MKPKYTAYIKGTIRKLIAEQDLTLDAAIAFLNRNRNGVIYLDDVEYTKKELLNVKNIRSDARTELDSPFASGETVSQDTGRELFVFADDNTE